MEAAVATLAAVVEAAVAGTTSTTVVLRQNARREQGPGLKATSVLRLFQGPEGPCSLRNCRSTTVVLAAISHTDRFCGGRWILAGVESDERLAICSAIGSAGVSKG